MSIVIFFYTIFLYIASYGQPFLYLVLSIQISALFYVKVSGINKQKNIDAIHTIIYMARTKQDLTRQSFHIWRCMIMEKEWKYNNEGKSVQKVKDIWWNKKRMSSDGLKLTMVFHKGYFESTKKIGFENMIWHKKRFTWLLIQS